MMAARQDWPGDGFDAFGRVVGNDPKRCEMFRDAMQGRLNRVANTPEAPAEPAPDQMMTPDEVAAIDDPSAHIFQRVYMTAVRPVTISDLAKGLGCAPSTVTTWMKRLVTADLATVERRIQPSGHDCKVILRVDGQQEKADEEAMRYRDARSHDRLSADVLASLIEDGPQGTLEISKRLKVSRSTALVHVKRLMGEGKVSQIGRERGVHYAATINGKVKL